MRKGKICLISHVNPFATGSGQIQRVYNTMIALASDWEQVTIYTLQKNKSIGSRVGHLLSINPNLKIIYLQTPGSLRFLKPYFHLLPYLAGGKVSNYTLPYIFRQVKINELLEYDVILFEYWHLFKLAAALKKRGKKVVCDTHNILLGSFKEYLFKKKWMPDFYRNLLLRKYEMLEYQKALKNSFDALIAINVEENEIFKKKIPLKKIIYCPMGIEFFEFKNEGRHNHKADVFTVVYFGGLGSARNTEAAIEVYNALYNEAGKEKNIKFKIIGSNPPEYLRTKVAANSMVSITGFIENLGDALSDADLAVIPFSGKYGFRSRIIELMYCEIPVLTTSDAVWGMGFKDDVNVFLFEQEDNLSTRIRSILNSREKRKHVAKNAKEFIRTEYSFENTYQSLSKELQTMLP